MINFCPGLHKLYCDSAWVSEDPMCEALVSAMSGVCVDMYIITVVLKLTLRHRTDFTSF